MGGQDGQSPRVQAPRVHGQDNFKIIFPLQCLKLLTDLQILGCELHKNAFGGRAPPGPAGGLYRSLDPPAFIRGRPVNGRGRKGLGMGGEEGKEVEG